MRIRFLPILLLLVAVAAGCRDDATVTPLAQDQDLPADQIIYDIQHTMTSEGVRNAVLNGDSAYLYQTGRTMDIIGVELTFFSETGRETGFLTAERGNYNSATGTMVARGTVVLVTRDTDGERRLETEELHYDLNGDRMWSDVPVVMREAGTTLHGTSFRADARFQNRTVTGARTSGGLEGEGRRISF
jgi:LPS export ABC transporter protein LptC